MLNWCAQRIVGWAERRTGAAADYLRHVAQVSPRTFFKFLLLGPAAGHRRRCSREMVHAARIVAARTEDCGPCVQIAVNMARRDGVDTRILQQILDGDSTSLPPEVALAVQFAQSVAERTGDDEHWRRQLLEKFSEEVIVELALAVAMARVFPTFKRGLGYARSCSLVQVSVDGLC